MNIKKNRILDIIIFVLFNALFCYMINQLHICNYRYDSINNFAISKAIIFYIIILLINGFIYFQFDDTYIFRVSTYIQFYAIYMFFLNTCRSTLAIYAPILILICVSFYNNKKIYKLHLYTFLGTIAGFICFVFYNLMFIDYSHIFITKSYVIHILICLVLSGCITACNYIIHNIYLRKGNHSINNIINTNGYDNNTMDNNNTKQDYLHIVSIEAISSNYNSQLEVAASSIENINVKADTMCTIISELKKDITIATSNSKSVSSLSAKLKKDVLYLSTISDELCQITSQIKTNLSTLSELFSSLLRTNFNVNSSHKNLSLYLDNIYSNNELLKDMLIELENLSIVTTHLANKATIEANQTPSYQVVQFIETEFNKYAEEIRTKVIHMSSTFDKLNSNYYNCKQELTTSDNLLASNSLIVNSLLDSIEMVNTRFNEILSHISTMEGLIDSARYKSNYLTADAIELNNAIHQFGKISYSLSRLRKSNTTSGKYGAINYLKHN